jgi:hypothetical protein
MEWTISYYDDELQRLIMEFPDGVQARFIHLTERMAAFGPDLGMPHCTLPGRRIFMLHAFIKKTAKTPARELKFARRRLKEIKGNADA